ncbi:MAG: hypothetical protein EOO75_13930 [Myxococcales bacterium]|nr:MAG: hypothetical protein EOO75_13930 [Myxococcales bacterium]
MEGAATPEAQRALLASLVDGALGSKEFYRTLVDYGHELLPIPSYNSGSEGYYWTGSTAFDLATCPDDTAHPGGFAMSKDECLDPDAPTTTSDVWFSPGKPVKLVGRAGKTDLVGDDGQDCGSRFGGGLYNVVAREGCGCGPGAQWCILSSNLSYGGPTEQVHHRMDVAASQRRQIWDEPARLLAHVIFHDRPFSDLVLGNYTVAPPALKNMYVRWARLDPGNKALDQSTWWKPGTWSKAADPENTPGSLTAWHEVVQQDLHPNLRSLLPAGAVGGDEQRTYTFDPRQEAGQPLGIPSAGVLTTLGALGSLSRERVRAARWLEVFGCQSFVPPPPEVHFVPYQTDPATEGTCQHCHVLIDPAAIHFKRPGLAGIHVVLGGIGPFGFDTIGRWDQSFTPGTRMTPISAEDAKAHPDWRLLDFLPTDQRLFDQVSDGTIGPLGFGKMLVKSGRFDRCAAQRIFERFVGRQLDPATDKARLDQLTAQFLAAGRKVKPFVRDLILDADEMRRGL